MDSTQTRIAAHNISSKPVCAVCSSEMFVESLLWCECCSKRHHTFCLEPPLVEFPHRRWLCPSCTSAKLPSRKRKLSHAGGGPSRSKARAVANGVRDSLGLGNVAAGRMASAEQKVLRNGGGFSATEGAAQKAATPAPNTNGVDADRERDPSDPGTTITLFCRRDFRRYLRWKSKALATQDDDKRKEEEMRARKTFSSIIANTLK